MKAVSRDEKHATLKVKTMQHDERWLSAKLSGAKKEHAKCERSRARLDRHSWASTGQEAAGKPNKRTHTTKKGSCYDGSDEKRDQ